MIKEQLKQILDFYNKKWPNKPNKKGSRFFCCLSSSQPDFISQLSKIYKKASQNGDVTQAVKECLQKLDQQIDSENLSGVIARLMRESLNCTDSDPYSDPYEWMKPLIDADAKNILRGILPNPDGDHSIKFFSKHHKNSKATFICDQVKGLNTLQENGIFSHQNCATVLAHENPTGVANALSKFYGAIRVMSEKFYTDQTLSVLVKTKNPDSAAEALIILNKKQLLNQENRDAVLRHSDTPKLAQALENLYKKTRLFTQENCAAVLKHSNPEALVNAIINMNTDYVSGRRDQEYTEDLQTISQHADPVLAVEIMIKLDRNFKTHYRHYLCEILDSKEPNKVADAFIKLHKAGIFTSETRAAVLRNEEDPIKKADDLIIKEHNRGPSAKS